MWQDNHDEQSITRLGEVEDLFISSLFSSPTEVWKSDITLEMLLCSTPIEFSNEEFQQMCVQIKFDQGKGVVFALDGLDEYSLDKKEYKTTFIHRLIFKKVLPSSTVIVASCPAGS